MQKPRIVVKQRPAPSDLTELPFKSKSGHLYSVLVCNDLLRRHGVRAALDEALNYYEGQELRNIIPNSTLRLEQVEHLMQVKMKLTQ